MTAFTVEDLIRRRETLGASDVPMVLGLSSFGDAATVYLEKISTQEPVLPDPNLITPMLMGDRLEPVALSLVADRLLAHGVHLGRSKGTIRVGWASATPDGYAEDFFISASGVNFDGIVEVKAVGPYMMAPWGDDDTDQIPPSVLAQVCWQMMVAGLERAYVGAILGGTEFRMYVINRNARLCAAIYKACEKFWTEHVVPRKPPTGITDPKILDLLHPVETQPLLEGTEDVGALCQGLARCQEMIKGYTEDANLKKAKIKEALGDSAGMTFSDGRSVTWRQDKKGKPKLTRVVADLAELLEVGDGTLAELIEKHTGEPARRFLLNWKEEEQP